MVKTIFSIILMLSLNCPAYGKIYFWTDEKGTKHYTNTTPPLNQNVQEIEESREIFKQLSAVENNQQTFKVLKIYDGDTIQVKGLGLVFKIRLVGIDSPEIGYKGQKSQPFSKKAKMHLIHLLKNNVITLKSYGTGAYNRQLAEVFSENKNINIQMIRAGLAEVYGGNRPRELDSKRYLQEMRTAKREKKGMWVMGKSYKSPRQWRKEHPRK